MKKYIFFLLLLPSFLFSFEVPDLVTRTNDFANIISSSSKVSLEKSLKDYEKKTGNKLFVLTTDTIGNAASIEQYSMAVVDKWKLGQKAIIIIIAKKERMVRIEVGDGLKNVISDATVSKIIKDDITPFFKKGDYSGGIVAGISSIIKHIDGLKKGPKKEPKRASTENSKIASKEKSEEWYENKIFIILAIALAVVIVLFLYLLPTVIMIRRGQAYGFFLLVNIIFGFTGLIWIVLLVIALTAKKQADVNTKQQT